MRVIHLTPSIGPLSGGMGTVALALAGEQRLLGCDATIWCVDPQGVAAVASSGGLEQRVIAMPPVGPRAFAYSRAAERRALTEPADIVHQHGVWTAQTRVTTVFRRRCIPTLVAPHGSLEPYARQRSAWKKRIALAAFESNNLRRASCLQATAHSEVSTFRDFGLRAPIAVLPNGVPASWQNAVGHADRFRVTHGLIQTERIMLFLSRVHPIKGLPLLIEALAANRERLAGWRLVIAGPDEASHREAIESLVEASGVSALVRFTGPLFDQDKLDAFAAAELFVLPTHSENFGIVIAEALGAGVPVLTTHGAPWRELGEHRCGWWVPVDARSIGAALSEATSLTGSELEAMGARGRDLVMSRYVWPVVAERALSVYHWLAGKGSRPDSVVVD